MANVIEVTGKPLPPLRAWLKPHRVVLIAIALALAAYAGWTMRWDWIPDYAPLAVEGVWRTLWLLVVTCMLGFALAVPAGPVWLIALVAILEGGGFGIAWTFVLRRVTTLSDPAETERISGAIPTVQRLGYALGAAYIGIIANAAGFAQADTAEAFLPPARWVFFGSLPLALVGLVAMIRFVSPAIADARHRQGKKALS